MKQVVLTILIFLPILGYCQIDGKALFNEERTMDRRFTLYQGQFRATGTYGLYVFKSVFDENGDKSLLSEKGISSNQNLLRANLRYGILNYLDIALEFNYKTNNYRGEPVLIIAPPATSVQLYTDISTKGLEDIYIGLNGRAPIPNKKLDLAGTFGAYLPSAKSQPDQPQHTYSSDGSGTEIKYYYLNNWGYGVTSIYYKGFLKYRFDNMALSGFYESRVPMGESEGLAWSSRLNDNNSFDYSSQSYTYQVPQTSMISGLIEFQLFQWINVFADFTRYSSINGWTEESGVRVAIPEEKQFILTPGYEILISTKLWLRQGISFPLSGENMYSQFSINTSFYYNLFMGK